MKLIEDAGCSKTYEKHPYRLTILTYTNGDTSSWVFKRNKNKHYIPVDAHAALALGEQIAKAG
ncbi:hypothetical protein [Fischerella sp. PCC 9605]|uniref:hypothetical protein n=1 Tax=Fischerella sp. PCC 9605 TaxID=1173024 RepID=UPI00047C9C93|nr:hypothetical protein [Fischerella sp. PCC 9605]